MKLKFKNFGEWVSLLKVYRKALNKKLKDKKLSDKEYFVDHVGLELLSVLRAYSYTRLAGCEGHINNYPLIKVAFEDVLLLNLAKKDYFPPEVYQVYRVILSANVAQGSRFSDDQKIQETILPILQKFGLQEKDLPALLKNPLLLYLINEKEKDIKQLFEKNGVAEYYNVYVDLGRNSIGTYLFPFIFREKTADSVQAAMMEAFKEFTICFEEIEKSKEGGYDKDINKDPYDFFVGKRRRTFIEHLMEATAAESFSTVFYSDFHHKYIETLGNNINWITAMNYFHEKLLPGLLFVEGINNSLTYWGPIKESKDSWELEYRLYAWTYSSFAQFPVSVPKENSLQVHAKAAYEFFFKDAYGVDKETFFENLKNHLTYAFSKDHEDLMTLFLKDYRRGDKLNNMDFQTIKDSYRLGQTLLCGGQFTYSYADEEEEDFSKLSEEMAQIWKKDMEQYCLTLLSNDILVKNEKEREDLIIEFHAIPMYTPFVEEDPLKNDFFRKSFLSSEEVRNLYHLSPLEDSDFAGNLFDNLSRALNSFEEEEKKEEKRPKKHRNSTKKKTQKKS